MDNNKTIIIQTTDEINNNYVINKKCNKNKKVNNDCNVKQITINNDKTIIYN